MRRSADWRLCSRSCARARARDRRRARGRHPHGDRRPTITAALVSDIGKFNDRGFNQNQLAGLNKAKAKLGVNDDLAAVELGQRLHPEPDARPCASTPTS